MGQAALLGVTEPVQAGVTHGCDQGGEVLLGGAAEVGTLEVEGDGGGIAEFVGDLPGAVEVAARDGQGQVRVSLP